MRVNFVGELGFELHHPIEMQNYIFDALMEAGAEFGIKPFGIRAMDSLRLEKSYKLVGRELSIEYAALSPVSNGSSISTRASSLVATRLLAWRDRGFANQLVTLEVHNVTDADARGSEPVTKSGAIDRPHDLGRLWLANRQVAGAGDGQAGVFRAGNRGRNPRARRDPSCDRHRGQPV